MVPNATAANDDAAAIFKDNQTALKISSSWNNSGYHRVEKPPHTVTSFESLNE